jgi:carbohydrate-binding DOMON domain-containing protein
LFEPGAQVRLNPENPWNKLLIVNGWWISLYTPDDSNKRVVDFTVTGQEVPWLINDPDINVNNNLIKLNIEKDKLGSFDNAYLYILVGSFDPFGYDYFRGIRKEKNSWFFAAPETEDLTYAPRVIDLIVPPEMDQTEILSNYNDDYPQIEPIYIGQKKMFGEYGIYIYLIIFALLLIISYIAVKTYKKRSGVTDNVEKNEQESD